MKKPSLPFLEARTKRAKSGVKTYWYFRRGKGKTTRLPDPEDPGFIAAYEAAKRDRPKPTRTSIGALVDSYMETPEFAEKAARTRRDYQGVLAHIKDVAGQHDVSKITTPGVIKARNDNRHRVRFANYIVQVYNILGQHAAELGWLPANPVISTPLLKVPKDRQAPHVPWPDAACAKWRAEAGPVELLAFEIGIGTMQRPADWPRFTWADYDGETLRLVQGKTGVKLQLPCTPALKAILDATPRTGFHILTRRDGRPMDYHYLARTMLAERQRLGLTRYDLHALRYRGVMELAWAGCDDDEIASYSGHASKAMVIKYAGEARQIMRARQAAAKRRERTEHER